MKQKLDDSKEVISSRINPLLKRKILIYCSIKNIKPTEFVETALIEYLNKIDTAFIDKIMEENK